MQAARFMDAGAHGGQIVCDEEMARAALGMLQELWEACKMGEGAVCSCGSKRMEWLKVNGTVYK